MEEDQGQRRADPVSRRTPASNATGSILPPSPLDQRWFVHLNDKTYGPYSGHDVKKFAVEGRITGTDLLYLEGGSAGSRLKASRHWASCFASATLRRYRGRV